ncbi:hypothetical protein [Vreelandella sp. TE19]
MRMRFSTQALGLANVLLLALLAWIFYTPARPQWLPADSPEATSASVAPLEARADLASARRSMVWTQPIFSPDRQADPDRQAVTANPLSSLTLAGIFQEGDAQWVYVDEPGQAMIKLNRGDTLDNGWTLEHLTPRTATFVRQGQTQTLSLPMLRLPPPSRAPTLTLPRTPTP